MTTAIEIAKENFGAGLLVTAMCFALAVAMVMRMLHSAARDLRGAMAQFAMIGTMLARFGGTTLRVVRKAGRWLGKQVSDARHPERTPAPRLPRWARKTVFGYMAFFSSYCAVLGTLMVLSILLFFTFPPEDAPWWKYPVGMAFAGVLTVAVQISIAQARDSWRIADVFN